MKKKVSVLLIIAVLVVSLFSVTGLASEGAILNRVDEKHISYQDEYTNFLPRITITEEEFKQLLEQGSMEKIQPKTVTCCDGYPNLSWRHRSTMHIYPQGGGLCLSLAYFGDQYCTKCGSVWQSNVCYKQTSSGCGRYHY